jgi:hypothetical protein
VDKSDQAACKPGSVSFSPLPKECDDHSSATRLATCLARPTRMAQQGVRAGNPHPSLFGLAPGGACRAPFLTVGAVRSYRTVSPLPVFAEALTGGLFSVALSLGSPPPGITRHLAFPEPGLSSLAPFRDLQERPPSRLIAVYVVVFRIRVKPHRWPLRPPQSIRSSPDRADRRLLQAGNDAGMPQLLRLRRLKSHIRFPQVA